jgi:hypothetical protein
MFADVPLEGETKDELAPELREAVKAVLHDEPPREWAAETLDKLRRHSSRPAPRQLRRTATWIALAAAACFLAVVVLHRTESPDGGREVVREAPGRQDEAIELAHGDAPTLWVYRQAARQSPEALDALLDKHAGQLLRPSSDVELAGLWEELL